MLLSNHPRRTFLSTLGATIAGSAIPFAPFLKKEIDLHSNKKEYLFENGLLYFHTAALGPCSKIVVDATSKAMYDLETNPSDRLYGTGDLNSMAEKTRQSAASLLGCNADEIMITRSTTDGMNAITQGLRLKPGDRILTTDQEHDGGSLCWKYLEHYYGVIIDVIEIPPGENDVNATIGRIESALHKDTRVISVSHILTSTGLRMPVEIIAEIARSYDIISIIDGAQAVGNVAVNVKSIGCHAYATSGHKWLMGPKGTGLLYISEEMNDRIRPMQFEDNRKFYNESTGVGNLPGAIGLGIAIENVMTSGITVIEKHNMALRNQLYKGLKSIDSIKIMSAAPGPDASPLITFELPKEIDSQEFRKSVLTHYHLSVKAVPKRWMNGIRLSPHIFNTESEVNKVLDILQTTLG